MWLKWTAPLVLAAVVTVAGASALAEKKADKPKAEKPAGEARVVEPKKREKQSQRKEARRAAREQRKAKREKESALAAVPYDGPAERVGRIEHAPVRESSGIAASRRHPGVFWTHNDKGNAARLYAIDGGGKLLAEFAVDARNDDWEDVAVDGGGHLYVGNIGNNGAKRDVLEVHRLSEPDPASANGTVPALKVERTWRLRFAGKPFDCESLFVHGDYGYVISKLFTGEPAAVYRFALEGGEEATLEKVTDLPIRAPVTAADLSADAGRLAVLSGEGLHVFRIDGDVSRAGMVTPQLVPLPRAKLEGVCFAPEGLLITAESREIYRVRQ
jgi:hypothetical protein